MKHIKNKNVYTLLGTSNHSIEERQPVYYYAPEPKALEIKIDDLKYELKNIDDKCKSYERGLNSIMVNDCITDDEEAEKIIKESKYYNE